MLTFILPIKISKVEVSGIKPITYLYKRKTWKGKMIKNMLKRRKESGTYLATDSRHRSSVQMTIKMITKCSFQLALQPSSAEED
jgi:hypothetical protein